MAIDLSSLGAGSSAVWTRAKALTLLSSSGVDRKLATEWQSPYPGVCADAGYDLDPVQWATAGVLVSGGEAQSQPETGPDPEGRVGLRVRAAACGRDAARVWGYPLVDDDDPATGGLERFVHDVHVFRRAGTLVAPKLPDQPLAHELRRHTLALYAGDLVLHDSGLWLTSALRTALDCCRMLTFEAAVCVVDHGLHRSLFSPEDLTAAIEARSGHPEIARLREVAEAADGRSEAASETLLRLILKPGWEELEPQVTVYGSDSYPVRRYDLGDRTLQLGVDADGRRNHAGDRMVAKDQRIDRRAGGYGWATERASWFEIRREQEQLRRRVYATRDRLRACAA